MQFNNYEVTSIAEQTYQIREESFVNSHLLSGQDRALLIDTGNGSGNLASVVRNLTSLPLTVLTTSDLQNLRKEVVGVLNRQSRNSVFGCMRKGELGILTYRTNHLYDK